MPDYVSDIRGGKRGRKIERSSENQMKRNEAGERENGWWLLGRLILTVKNENQEKVRQTQNNMAIDLRDEMGEIIMVCGWSVKHWSSPTALQADRQRSQ